MDRPFLDKLRKTAPYVPGEQPKSTGMIKLNANENPYPPAPGVGAALSSFDYTRLALYPDANGTKLKRALAEREGLSVGEVFLGNGSDDVLALAFQAFFCSDRPVLFPDITYSFYPVWCELFHVRYETVPLNENWRINPRDYDRINGGVIIPNPNAPTGWAEPVCFFEDILERNRDCVVIIDEAYVDFGAESCIKLIKRYENLLIVQTTSKSRSLAGMRIGCAFGSELLINTLESVKNSYNSYTMDALALELGAASVADENYFNETCRKIMYTRERTASELTSLGFEVLPSMANFLFATHPEKSARLIFERLREKNIFVRHFNIPRIENFLRITIGTDVQMDSLISALHNILDNI